MGEDLVLRVALVEAGLILLSVSLLLGHAAVLAVRRRRQGPRLARATGLLRSGLHGTPLDDDELNAIAGLSTTAQVGLFSELGSSLRGGQKERLTQIAADVGLVRKAERWCSSRRWGTRLRGARVLTLLGTGAAVVPTLFDDPRPEVRAQAAQWAGDHPDAGSIDRLLAMLSDGDILCRFTVKDSLLRLGPDAVEALRRHIEREPVPDAIEVAAGIGDDRFLDVGLEQCGSRDARTRALAATLVGSVGGAAATDVLTDLLRDPDLSVRAAAAESLGRLGHWPAAGDLAERLRDSSWDVRSAAALALRALGAPGILLLRRALSDRDRFARDMARQVLELPAGPSSQAAREPAVV